MASTDLGAQLETYNLDKLTFMAEKCHRSFLVGEENGMYNDKSIFPKGKS